MARPTADQFMATRDEVARRGQSLRRMLKGKRTAAAQATVRRKKTGASFEVLAISSVDPLVSLRVR